MIQMRRTVGLPRRDRRRPWLLHLFRLAVLATAAWLVRDQHVRYLAQREGQRHAALTIERILRFYPRAASLGAWNPAHGGQNVLDAAGDPLGYVVQTSPSSDTIIGYAGPTNALLAFDAQDRILGLEILSSGDTGDHLRAVLADRQFLAAFNGLSWREAAARTQVDGVCGATLTSSAIIEGVIRRLGGQPHSYRFPAQIELDEVRPFLPAAARLTAEERKPGLFRVVAASGELLGFVGRTSPVADDLIGYQGPTDTLFIADARQRIVGIAMRRTYETDEYAGWVADDRHFLTCFNDRTLDALAELNPEEAGIEGTSGATMTSMAMAHALRRAARAIRDTAPAADPSGWRIAASDWGVAAVIFGGLLLAFTNLRGRRWVRVCFQVLVIGYLGFVNGSMVSQALLVGWVQSGVPWRLAPGLALLVGAAFVTPSLTRRQLYCHHLCPHGAAQQLLKNALPRRWKPVLRPPPWVTRCASLTPYLLLAWVVIVAMRHLGFNLAAIEPFDAYLVRIAGWGTLGIAVIGLVASLWIPMAYCRYGCPTGAVLNHVRRQGIGDRFRAQDGAALALVALAVGLRVLGG